MKKIISITLFLIISIIAGKFLLSTAAAQDKKLFATSDCVVNTAIVEGFQDPYSQEAWSLFSSQCEK